MTKERIQELLDHVRTLMGSDKQSGRLYALELKTDLETLLEEKLKNAEAVLRL